MKDGIMFSFFFFLFFLFVHTKIKLHRRFDLTNENKKKIVMCQKCVYAKNKSDPTSEPIHHASHQSEPFNLTHACLTLQLVSSHSLHLLCMALISMK